MKQFFKLLLSLFLSAVLLICPAFGADWTDQTAPPEYEALFPAGDPSASFRTRSTEGLSEENTVLRGKSILFFGDSQTAGYRLDSYSDTWCAMLGTVYGMKVTTISISGSTIGKSETYGYKVGGCYEPYVDRVLPDGDFDIIYISGGGNDYMLGLTLGTDLTSRDPYNFMGAVNVVIDRVREKYPDSLLLFSTPFEPYNNLCKSYYDAMIQICAMRGVTCFQAMDTSLSGIYPNNSKFRETYFLTTTDYWHLNAAGQALYLPTIAAWLAGQVGVRGFRDVDESAWYAGAVGYAYDAGLMIGVGDDNFAPAQNITRGMLLTTLYRAAGSPSVAGLTMPFTDVAANAYYHDAALWAYDAGLVTGVDDTRLALDDDLTRQDMAVVLCRLAGTVRTEEGVDLSACPSLAAFSDREQIPGYALASLDWAVEQELLVGTGYQILDPAGTATRAQLATVLQRYLDRFGGLAG